VIEFERRAPIIVDRSLYRELCKQAITRSVSELEDRVAEREQERKSARQNHNAGRAEDPQAASEREAQRQLRELGRQAHGINLDLGAGLLTGLSSVDPTSMDVARFFVYALLGSDHDGSTYTQTGERVAHLAMCGIRLVIGDFRTDATKTLKNGQPGTTRIDYGDAHDPAAAIKWLWKYVDGAKTAGELYGRALAVIAAEQYACRLVVAQTQRGYTTHWGSHNDRALKALAKLAKPHLPGSLTQLQMAIAQTHDDLHGTQQPGAAREPAESIGEADEPAQALEDEDLND
jgi:hypothetical protein